MGMVAVLPLEVAAVIVAVPAVTPQTRPSLPTLAIPGFEEVHVTDLFVAFVGS